MIIEKKLGIPPDYQYRAITKGIWLQRNWHRNKFEIIRNQMNANKSKVVLDLGTGSGNFEILYANLFKSVVGVDHNDEALSFLSSQLKKRHIKNVNLIHADIRKLPETVKRVDYDIIVIIDAIEHLSFADAKETLNNIKSLLSKKGQLIIITPNYKSIWLVLENLLDRMSVVPRFLGKQHLTRFDQDNLSRILKKAGYMNIRTCSFNLFSYLFPVQTIRRFLLSLETRHIDSFGCLICVSAQLP